MPWWAWLLLGWSGVSTTCAAWWGLALANAEVQEAARRVTEASELSEY